MALSACFWCSLVLRFMLISSTREVFSSSAAVLGPWAKGDVNRRLAVCLFHCREVTLGSELG